MSAYIRVYIVIYGGIYRPHRGSNKVVIEYVYTYIYLITAPIYGYIYAYIYPIDTLIYGLYIYLLLLPNMAYYCSKIWPIAPRITALVQIRYKAWRFLIAFRIVLIFVPLNGAYMRAYMGHTGAAMGHACAHTWPYMGAAMGHARAHTWPYMGAAMGHACAHTWPYMGQPYREGRDRE